ncbi:MAG: VIT1/CCC1 transporter family protein [Patescibacteria group bacterium]
MTEGEHLEEHKQLNPAVRDIIIGTSDGLTVPFAIAAGLASANVSDATIIIAAVLAEIAAGSVSMGLGGYLAANTEAKHYASERAREEWEVEHKPDVERKEVQDFFIQYGLTAAETVPIVNSLSQRKKDWVDFMMRFELGLEEPDKRRAFKSALTIGGAYIVGGLIPLSPYIIIGHADVERAFVFSIFTTFVALVVFGFLRGRVIGTDVWRSLAQTVFVGALAAFAAFMLAKLVP